MKKRRFVVSIPIAGAIHVEVDAVSESDARTRAWDRVNDEGEAAGDVEWEFFDEICEGNVCHAPLNEIVASEVKIK